MWNARALLKPTEAGIKAGGFHRASTSVATAVDQLSALEPRVPWHEILTLDTKDTDLSRKLAEARHMLAESAQGISRPRLLVSACLLGHPVTYRGKPSGWTSKSSARHSPAGYVVDVLGNGLGLVACEPFCPEMQLLKLTAPRHPVRLMTASSGISPSDGDPVSSRIPRRFVQDSSSGAAVWDYDANKLLRLPRKAAARSVPPYLSSGLSVDRSTGTDAEGSAYPNELCAWLAGADGVLVKAKSPSCGLGDARLYAKQGDTTRFSLVDGFFVKCIKDAMQHFPSEAPLIPIHSEQSLGRLPAATARPLPEDLTPVGIRIAPFVAKVVRHAKYRNDQRHL